jgi:zinc and cadmium transporter
MQIWLYTFVSVILLSAMSFLGVFLKEEKIKNFSLFVISFAVGALFGDAFVHILPESFSNAGRMTTSLFVMIGIVVFFSLEKFLRWRHCHIPASKDHYHPVVSMNMVGDTFHNLIDGMIIGASYLVNIPLGIATSLAIVFHEVPQKIGDFGILVYGGLSKKKAVLFTFLASLAGILGGLASLIVGSYSKEYVLFLMPIAAGGFLYIAGSDLIPELHHETKVLISLGQLVSIMLGAGVMVALTLLG